MTKYDDIIYDIASDNFGLITSAEAREAGVSNMELVQYARRGRLERIGQGLYRLTRRTPEANDSYAAAVALVGPEAYLYGEGVLGMLELCPVNPAYIPVATPKRVRKQLPSYIRVVNPREEDAVETYDGIRSQSVAAAIRSCLPTVLPDRLTSAVETAFAEGYINESEKKALAADLEVVA
ncbi:type IV toxin-antitoxin system AbiEi family antitoxin domain-containing protein [Adlercreutzia sp. ZJ138]|uniref:type IV toxin-antitoxin system AbiEi family antitoxin domain-containing protein n=1 Tax=Adlercreutzia sp. ZJ138 TaxID=2709405 RepID=UPI0013EB3005|nr:type IV toxin-antitoxin system AbiEi family antitoxin domain-containing protein [Adlercreutzia sp. ZJ138]